MNKKIKKFTTGVAKWAARGTNKKHAVVLGRRVGKVSQVGDHKNKKRSEKVHFMLLTDPEVGHNVVVVLSEVPDA